MERAAPTTVFLVRHAQTEWNASKVFQGNLDSNLTPEGLRQAQQLATRLSREPLAAVYSSDQGRSLRTAETVAAAASLQVVPSLELREIDCGEWTGRGYQEVRELWPVEFYNWKNRPHVHHMPGGESVLEVQQRALRFIRGLGERHPGQVVCVVTHHTVVRTVVCALRGMPLEKLWEGSPQANCAINVLELDGEGSRLVAACDSAHLTAPTELSGLV